MCYVHRLTIRNIWVSFMKIAKGIRRYGTDTQFKGNSTDLDHEFSNCVICSAHRLTKKTFV